MKRLLQSKWGGLYYSRCYMNLYCQKHQKWHESSTGITKPVPMDPIVASFGQNGLIHQHLMRIARVSHQHLMQPWFWRYESPCAPSRNLFKNKHTKFTVLYYVISILFCEKQWKTCIRKSGDFFHIQTTSYNAMPQQNSALLAGASIRTRDLSTQHQPCRNKRRPRMPWMPRVGIPKRHSVAWTPLKKERMQNKDCRVWWNEWEPPVAAGRRTPMKPLYMGFAMGAP